MLPKELKKAAKVGLEGLSQEELGDLQQLVVSQFVDALIADGRISVEGKAPEQVFQEARKMILENLEAGGEVIVTPTFHESLLAKARNSMRLGDMEGACLHYATWFEHWVNHVITRERFGLSLSERKQMVRDVSLNGKFSWLMPALGMKRIPEQHLNTIKKISEARNGFVHFKFDISSNEMHDERKAKTKAAALLGERAVRYLLDYERKHVFFGLKGLGARNLKKDK